MFLTLGKRSVSYRGWFWPGRTGYGDFIMNFRLWFYQRTNNSPEKQHFITGGYRWEGVTVSTLFFRKCKPKKERGLILRPQNAWLKSNWGVLPQPLSMPTGDSAVDSNAQGDSKGQLTQLPSGSPSRSWPHPLKGKRIHENSHTPPFEKQSCLTPTAGIRLKLHLANEALESQLPCRAADRSRAEQQESLCISAGVPP